jgi:hypothetical protein
MLEIATFHEHSIRLAKQDHEWHGRDWQFANNVRNFRHFLRVLGKESPDFQLQPESKVMLSAWDSYLSSLMPGFGNIQGLTLKRWTEAVDIVRSLAEATDYDISHLTSFQPQPYKGQSRPFLFANCRY